MSSELEGVTISNPYHSEVLAKHIVETLLGEDNDYLERLLVKQLEGKRCGKETTLPPLGDKMKCLKEDLDNKVKEAHTAAVKQLSAHDLKKLDKDAVKTASALALNTVLEEKLQDRLRAENSEKWKWINGIVAAILPVVTTLITYFVTASKCNDST